MPFGLHSIDLIVVVVVALLVFGPKRLPQMGAAVGQTFRSFQQSMKEITGEHAPTETPHASPVAAPLIAAPTSAEPVAPPAHEPALHQ